MYGNNFECVYGDGWSGAKIDKAGCSRCERVRQFPARRAITKTKTKTKQEP